ncbi:MAG: NAD+ synthase [Calditrichia bacterium]
MQRLNLALAQINPTVGDISGNFSKICDYIDRAREIGADIVAFPELALTGYPPEDLLLKADFIDENLKYLEKLVAKSKGLTVVVGFVDRRDDIFNAAAVLHDGELAGVYHKMYLPNYGVFDENRYFQAGQETGVFELNGIRFGVNICEDIWYPGGPTRKQALYGSAELIINISSSPYHFQKARDRQKMLSVRAQDNEAIIAYVNTVGGQDELVFDGYSMVFSQAGELLARGPAFEEGLITCTVNPQHVFRNRLKDPRRRKERFQIPPEEKVEVITLKPLPKKKKGDFPQSDLTPFPANVAEVYQALTVGLRDYLQKNRFKRVVIGLSGGVDSALVATIARDAVGKENVVGVSMPSEYTSRESKEDAQQLAENLGIEFHEIPITPFFHTFLEQLNPYFKGKEPDITEENIQARIRGTILMSLSNKFGWLVLATGNKSEVSVGYCTLYGDMVGGFSVIKDVPKTLVYELCRYRNEQAGQALIPERILTKAPSAELKPDQKDSDSLPPYDILDPILKAYVEDDYPFSEIVEMGFDPATVERVIRLVDSNEYKRRQAAPGIKITHRAFGKDRRVPITNRFKPLSQKKA